MSENIVYLSFSEEHMYYVVIYFKEFVYNVDIN